MLSLQQQHVVQIISPAIIRDDRIFIFQIHENAMLEI